MKQLHRRVVVTGLGILSPIGNNVDDAWYSCIEGKSGITTVDIGLPNSPVTIGGRLKNFDANEFLDSKEVRRIDPFIQYGIIAANQSIENSGILDSNLDLTKVGVNFGAGIGGIDTIEKNKVLLEERGYKKVSPFFVPGSIVNMISGLVSIKHGFMGPNTSVVTACSTGNHCIGTAARSIACGEADVMIAGGAEIYAEIIGFGTSSDAHHMTAPPEDGRGAALAMTNAIDDSEINLSEVDYINAHGTSTPLGDIAETIALKNVFGETVPQISSTKSMTGHTLGAAGAIESIFCIKAINEGIIPPTINLDNPDSHCDLNYTPLVSNEKKVSIAMNNSFGFGGTNSTLVFKNI